MDGYQEFAIGMALMRLEEELNTLRQLVFSLPSNLSVEELENLLRKGLILLQVSSDILSTLNNEKEDTPFLRDINFGVFEALFITQTLLEKVEKQLPVFWDQLTVFDEPLLEKLRQVINTLHTVNETQNDEQIKTIDYAELAYILQDIAKTLDAVIHQSTNLKKKIL